MGIGKNLTLSKEILQIYRNSLLGLHLSRDGNVVDREAYRLGKNALGHVM